MSKKVKIIIAVILIGIILALAGYISYHIHFKYEWAYDRMMKSPETLDKSREMSNEELLYNLRIIARREGGDIYSLTEGYMGISDNEESSEAEDGDTQNGDVPEDGNEFCFSFDGRFVAGEKKPVEIRFIMQAFLYMKDRNLSDDFNKFAGISGYYRVSPIITFKNRRYAQIGVEEFEALYDEYNADVFSHEAKVDLLTHAWIYETGYDREGIDQKYRVTPPDMSKYLK